MRLNRLTNMVDGVGTNRYTYTSGGFLATEGGVFANDVVTNIYTNRLRIGLSLAQPTGSWTNAFGYDAAKRLTSVTSPAGAFNYTYDPNRQREVDSLSLPNSCVITNDYDPVARLLGTFLNNSSGTTLDSARYGYNVGNQRTTYTNVGGTNVSYTYDNIGQLTVAASSVTSQNRGYEYDAAWNLNTRTNNGTPTTYGVNDLNELTNIGSLDSVYDPNGNLSSRTSGSHTTNYYYDCENRLTGVQWYPTGTSSKETIFVYDGLGRLREQLQWSGSASIDDFVGPSGSGYTWTLTSGKFYIYDGKRVIQERDTNSTPTVAYTRGNDLNGSLEGAGGIGGLLARSDTYSSGSFSDHNYYHADGNGNITSLVNSSQTLAAYYQYDAFGNTLSSSGSLASSNTYQFSSKEFVSSVGLYYYLYRFYDPYSQRWLNRDPIEEKGGLNLYEFASNDSLNFVDTDGREWWKPTTWSWWPWK